MEPYIVEIIFDNKETIIDRWLEEVGQVRNSKRLTNISDDVFRNTNFEFVNIILSNINLEQSSFSSQLSDFSERLMKLGWPLSYLTEGLQIFRRVVLDLLFDQKYNVKEHLLLISGVDKWIDPIINQLVESYSGSWENIVSLQKIALQELSAPLIPVFENITVMPLVGTIDTERAKFIMENLLDGVIKHRAEVVLIDITGVPVVDTMVAHHIIQAAEAVRLIGAQCILVGIRPEIAQTIVNLGINLNEFPTKSSMRKGMETALSMTNRQLTDLE
ncbi:RsbT co-antagonist protein RsbRA [Bacillus marinisedimentorum]|uniref:RsbT co-antagonist protein RsbRA n=1 Tax=Bacillus marinisedimentorum TaxID=1821260 RepID=UPI0008731BE0|nr:RsbT co-antagonist protein RsbRA [Bacillus marinisedimentorum]